MHIKTALFIILSIIIGSSCSSSTEKPPEIPLEDFFKNPEKSYFKISPNGKYISYTAPWKNRMNIYIQEIGKDSAKQITFEDQRSIGGYIWANDTRILYAKDENGNEDFKLYAVNIDGSELNCLTCYPNVRATLIDDLVENPEEIIVGLNIQDSTVFDPYRLNILTGDLTLLAQNPGNIINWETDHNGKLRLATAIEGGVNQILLYRDNEAEDFKPVLKTTWKNEFIPQFFTFDNKMVYALSNIGRDKLEVVAFDPKSKTETEVLFKHPDVDVSKISYSKKRKVLTTAYYTTDKKQEYFFDDLTKENYHLLKSKLKGYEVSIVSTDLSEQRCIVKAYSDKTKGKYYLYDKKFEKLSHIATVGDWLKEEHLAEMKPISYKSRDGLTIHGYLTLPLGIPAKNLPVVINPHGGPWIRDYWGFDPEVQFLANRGYAVLQMNYRGSSGYGKRFWLKSVKQWGKDMQNDITDGAVWLTEKGIADPGRIAIYGSSWGGYAALAGATYTPDLYACAIDYVGPSNLFTFLESLPPYWEPMREMWYTLIGHPEKDSLLLQEISPALNVEKISIPILIAQGANDPRINRLESDQMVDALRTQGVEVKYIVKEDEGHGFKNEENRFALYLKIETFLKDHMMIAN